MAASLAPDRDRGARSAERGFCGLGTRLYCSSGEQGVDSCSLRLFSSRDNRAPGGTSPLRVGTRTPVAALCWAGRQPLAPRACPHKTPPGSPCSAACPLPPSAPDPSRVRVPSASFKERQADAAPQNDRYRAQAKRNRAFSELSAPPT